jgi:hypothetical protein
VALSMADRSRDVGGVHDASAKRDMPLIWCPGEDSNLHGSHR